MSVADTLARTMPPVQHADVNGLSMAYYEVNAGQGVPVVFCHGFPELAFSWRHQLAAFAAAGRWAIAPDQRGYGGTPGPAEVDGYDMAHLTGDLVALLDAKGIDRAIFCGHDWGGIVVWQLPLLHPDRVAGVIGLNTPFMPRPPVDPVAIFRHRFGDDMYIVWFQQPDAADRVLGADPERTMRFFMQRPRMTQAEYQALPDEQRTLALGVALQAWEPGADERPLLDADELAVFAETFRRTGFTGGINWYRNFGRNWEAAEGLEQHVAQPALMIMAENDVVLAPSMADGMEQWVPDLERHLVHGSGHWTQQEAPDEVNRVILEWVERRFPRGDAA